MAPPWGGPSNGIFHLPIIEYYTFTTGRGHMTVNYFLYIKAPQEIRDPLRNLYRNSVVPGLLKNNQIESIHLFTRYIKGRLSNDDENPPELTLQIDFGSIEGLHAIFASSELATLFPLLGASDATQDVSRPIHYPIAGEVNSLPRRAPMSYNVRYYQPIEDENKFVGSLTTSTAWIGNI